MAQRKRQSNWKADLRLLLKDPKAKLRKSLLGQVTLIVLAVLVFLGTVWGMAAVLFEKVGTTFENKEFKEVVYYSPTMHRKEGIIKSSADLFNQPNQFFYGSLAKNEIADIIQLVNNNISINITSSDCYCGIKYVLKNFESIDKKIFHKLIPMELYNSSRVVSGTDLDAFYETFDNDEIIKVNPGAKDYAGTDPSNLPSDCLIATMEDEIQLKWFLPGLDIKINNNLSDNILIESISVLVKKSSLNSFPLLGFEVGQDFDLPIVNYGWGGAKNINMYFKIQELNLPVNYKDKLPYHLQIPELRPTPFDYSIPPTNISIKDFLRKEGMDVDSILSTQDYFKILKNKKYVGRFKHGQARFVGFLTYEGILPSGHIYKDTIDFNFIQNVLGGGMGGPESSSFHATHQISLNKSGENYKRSYNVYEEVAPNSSNIIKVSFYSGKSTYHLFDLIINYNGNKKIIIENIFLNEFFDKSILQFLKSKKTQY